MKQPLSYIHPNAKIAKNVVIEPFTSIDGDVEIGEGTWIGYIILMFPSWMAQGLVKIVTFTLAP